MLLMVACLILSAPSVGSDLETNYMDMVGAYFIVSFGPDKEVWIGHNTTFLLTNQRLLFNNVMGIDMDLRPSISVLWFAETGGEVNINITEEIDARFYRIANTTGSNTTTPVLQEVNISGITWHTISDPLIYVYVAAIGYTNLEETGVVLIEARARDEANFRDILGHVRLEEKQPNQLKSGPPLQYFF